MKRYTNAQIAKVVKYIIENIEMLNNALDDALRVTEIEQQNKRYREAIEVAIHNMADSDNLGVKFALGILEQALEGEE